MKIRWEPSLAGPYPHFDGEFEIHPLGLKTELTLVGSYEPPGGIFGAAFDAVIGSKIAQISARTLLEDLKAHLEADYATVRDTIEQTPPRT
jgi:hypothetical protein